jgi:hypothetical protein
LRKRFGLIVFVRVVSANKVRGSASNEISKIVLKLKLSILKSHMVGRTYSGGGSGGGGGG